MGENLVSNYGWQHSEGPHSCGYIIPEITQVLADLQSRRVVDVGCGNGALVRAIEGRVDHVVGVELDRGGCEIARKESPHLSFYNMGVQDDPAPIAAAEGSFDTVVSSEVIEHLFSPHLLPQFSRQLLDTNGYLVLTTPYHGYFKNLALSVFDKWDAHHTALWHGGHIKF